MQNDLLRVHWVLDIGNTSAKLAIFQGSQKLYYSKIAHEDLHRTLDELETQFKYHARVYSNVSEVSLAPSNKEWKEFTARSLSTWEICYQPSDNLGVDRLSAAIGAHSILTDTNALIVDCGTCVTYTWVKEKTITGLAIAPGRYMRWKAMHQFTRQLPLVNDGTTSIHEHSTLQNLWIGGHVGWMKEVEAMCEMFLSQHSIKEIIFTGTDALYLKDFLPEKSQWIEGLNLIGLNVWLHEQ